MVEETRTHERLVRRDTGGTRRSFAGPLGKPVEVWIPDGARRDSFDLVIHYLGAAWLPEQAVSHLSVPTVAAVVSIGAGSGIYDRTFSDPAVVDSLLAGIAGVVRAAAGGDPWIRHLTLSGFSAGHGAIRAVLRDPRHAARVDAIRRSFPAPSPARPRRRTGSSTRSASLAWRCCAGDHAGCSS